MSGRIIRQVGMQAAVYGLGGVLNRLLGFLLLPVYTRFLTPADYGVFALLTVTTQIATIFVQLGIGSAIFREVLYRGSDESTVESTALYFLLVEAALLLGCLAAFARPLSTAIFSDPRYSGLLIMTFATGFLASTELVAMAHMRIHQRAGLYSLLSVCGFLLGASLNIYFVVFLRRGVAGLVTAGLVAAAIRAAIYNGLIVRRLRPTFSRRILGNMLQFGVPLIPFGLGRMVLNSSDRYFLGSFGSTTEVGIYSIGYSMGIVINIMVGAVQLAWPAQMFGIAKTADAERTFARILTYYLTLVGYTALGLSVLAPEVLTIMADPKFHDAYRVVPLIALSYVLYGATYIANTGIEIKAKTKYMGPIIMLAGVVNLGLNFLLIPRFGMMGAAVATLLSFLVLAAVQVRVNLRLLHVPYEYGRLAKLGGAWLVVYGASTLVAGVPVSLAIAIKLGLLVGFPVSLFAIRFFEERELNALLRLWRTGWARLRVTGATQ